MVSFIVKLPGYCFVGIFLIALNGAESGVKRRIDNDEIAE
jgi:hypothetical protein